MVNQEIMRNSLSEPSLNQYSGTANNPELDKFLETAYILDDIRDMENLPLEEQHSDGTWHVDTVGKKRYVWQDSVSKNHNKVTMSFGHPEDKTIYLYNKHPGIRVVEIPRLKINIRHMRASELEALEAVQTPVRIAGLVHGVGVGNYQMEPRAIYTSNPDSIIYQRFEDSRMDKLIDGVENTWDNFTWWLAYQFPGDPLKF